MRGRARSRERYRDESVCAESARAVERNSRPAPSVVERRQTVTPERRDTSDEQRATDQTHAHATRAGSGVARGGGRRSRGAVHRRARARLRFARRTDRDLSSSRRRCICTPRQGSVEKLAGFNIRELNPIEFVDKCQLPTLFMCARHDDFVGMHHTKMIYEKYAGPKEIIMVDGDHNSLRNEQALTAAGVFLQRQLKIPPSWAIPYSAQVRGDICMYARRERGASRARRAEGTRRPSPPSRRNASRRYGKKEKKMEGKCPPSS